MDAIVTDQPEIVLTDVNPNLEDIYSDVRSNMATLILGPDFLTENELSARQSLFLELQKTNNCGILHFYPSNGIFLFDSPNSKFNSQKAAAKFYDRLQPNKELLDKIIHLPFSLILNTNPDKSLVKLFSEKKKNFQFEYFSRRPNKNKNNIEDPNPENPLIYNLFGSVEEFQSLVLDFEDLFNHLTTLFNNTNVPNEVRTVLKNTYTFIFLGFQLEKWDTQLLFRYINMNEQEFDNRKKNYTKKPSNIDEGSESFFTKQLNVRFYMAPVDFIENIYSKYTDNVGKEEDEKIQKMDVIEAIRYLLNADKIEKAFSLIKNNCVGITETELAILKGQYSRYLNIKNSGTEKNEDINILFNKLIYDIEQLVHVDKKTDTPSTLANLNAEDAICYFIGMDDLEGALGYLEKFVNNDTKVEYFTIKGLYSNYTNLKKEGVQSFDDLEIMRNKIRQSIFGICDKIKTAK
ncbi:MAG: hypothetical protein BGN92_02315 [Sphingobacteriales bacterium 41-5]|nr:MAG: hypothetical protein BGN92_02315 [Sphingobacteriales bacterium 41-5]